MSDPGPTEPRDPKEIISHEEWASAWGEDEHGVFMVFAVGGVEQRLRWITPGTFLMGAPPEEIKRVGFQSEGPQHTVTLTRGYWLADTPVTQALWEAVMGSNPSRWEGDISRPVGGVSWDDCQRFCEELNQRIPGFGARLPTSAEWEHACRAGTTTATYAGNVEDPMRSAVLDPIAWYGGNSDHKTHPVKLKRPNAWGLYDMLGNVWEWCRDGGLHPYSSGAQQDPIGPASTDGRRVTRGGCCGDPARYLRAACRYSADPGSRGASLGLRLGRDQAAKPG